MNTLTIVLVILAVIVILVSIIYVLIKRLKAQNKRIIELEASFKKAEQNIAYLVKHSQEIAEIKTEESASLQKVAEAKTDEEIFEIVNNIVALNNDGL